MSLNKIDLTWLDRTAVKYLGIDSEISRALILYAPRAYFCLLWRGVNPGNEIALFGGR